MVVNLVVVLFYDGCLVVSSLVGIYFVIDVVAFVMGFDVVDGIDGLFVLLVLTRVVDIREVCLVGCFIGGYRTDVTLVG